MQPALTCPPPQPGPGDTGLCLCLSLCSTPLNSSKGQVSLSFRDRRLGADHELGSANLHDMKIALEYRGIAHNFFGAGASLLHAISKVGTGYIEAGLGLQMQPVPFTILT